MTSARPMTTPRAPGMMPSSMIAFISSGLAITMTAPTTTSGRKAVICREKGRAYRTMRRTVPGVRRSLVTEPSRRSERIIWGPKPPPIIAMYDPPPPMRAPGEAVPIPPSA